MYIFFTPHTPRYKYVIFYLFIFLGSFNLFSEEIYSDSLEYQELVAEDYLLISGFIPVLSYDILENNFSLKISLNNLVTNSIGLYKNSLKKKIFRNNFFEEKLKKKELELSLKESGKKNLEEKLKKLELELFKIDQNILSVAKLISHKEELKAINDEIYIYQESKFKSGDLESIDFMQYKKSYLEFYYELEELIYLKENLINETEFKRSEISNCKGSLSSY